MKPHPPHPKLRKTIKWGGAAVTVLLVAVWIGSGWIGPDVPIPGPGSRWSISHGCIVRASNPAVLSYQPALPWGKDLRSEYTVDEGPTQFTLLWGASQAKVMGFDFLALPFWPVILLTAAPAFSLWYIDVRARRRARVGRCPNCNYDRSGLAPGVVCPECGEKPKVA